MAGTTALGAFAGFKALKGIWDLPTASTSLQIAAAELQAAAASLSGGNVADMVEGPGNKKGRWFGAGWAGTLASLAWLLNESKTVSPEQQEKISKRLRQRERAEEAARLANPCEVATDYMNRRQAFEADTAQRGTTPGLDQYFGRDGVTRPPRIS